MKIEDSQKNADKNAETLKTMTGLAKTYTSWIENEMKIPKEELKIKNIGKIDPKKHISKHVEESL